MNRRLIQLFVSGAILAQAVSAAEPTEVREWRAKAGSTITAQAMQMNETAVQLKAGDRLIPVQLDLLVDEDRSFLIKHFGFEGVIPEPGKAIRSQIPLSGGEELGHPQGETVGPIQAGDGSSYFLYLPKSLRKDRPAPLLLFTGAGGGKANSLQPHIAGAEQLGWVVAACVESKNGQDFPMNHRFAEACVDHLLKTLPLDPQRVYFTGGSGGGAMSMYNAARIQSAGAMPHIGYIPSGTEMGKGHFFVINGTTDYNRYTSAHAVELLGKQAIHRFHPGGHKMGPEWLVREGMVWLNGQYLAGMKDDEAYRAECLDFEASMVDWIGALRESTPYRAYYWCRYLTDDYGIEGHNGKVVEEIAGELIGDAVNAQYADGIAALDEFSATHFTKFGTGSSMGHSTPAIKKAASALATEFVGVPQIEELANQLGEPTVGTKKK